MNKEKGAIETLCNEIDFRFDKILERDDLLISFVSVLVSKIAEMRYFQDRISEITSKAPSGDSKDVLQRVQKMLLLDNSDALIKEAGEIHDFIRTVVPEEAYPCDHLIDMLSSCVSAIRFGLEKKRPYSSRHAAEAADHIWKHVYGISLFDGFTSNWRNDWVRAQLQTAIALKAFPIE